MSNQSSKRYAAVTFLSFASLSALAFGVAFTPGQSVAAVSVDSTELQALAARAETESYVAEIKSVGTYAAGKQGNVEIVLTAKAPYHLSNGYPYKFVTPDPAPAGITYPKPKLTNEDGKFTETSASFQLPFVASKAGKYNVGGKLSLSVCSDANCLMEKLDLDLDVDVK